MPFALAAFIRAGASTACLMRPEGCGYLLLLALASESFTFVYLLVKDAIHLEAALVGSVRVAGLGATSTPRVGR